MRLQRNLLWVGVGAIIFALLASLAMIGVKASNDAGAASTGDPAADPTVNQYAAEFACGAEPECAIIGGSCRSYRSEISIHNPNTFDVFIQKKVVGMPPPEDLGAPTPRRRLTMTADSAFHIDCADIMTFFDVAPCPPSSPASPGVCRGYVVIESATASPFGGLVPAQLDVTVTTFADFGSSSSFGISHDFEFVSPKRVNYGCWSNTGPICPL